MSPSSKSYSSLAIAGARSVARPDLVFERSAENVVHVLVGRCGRRKGHPGAKRGVYELSGQGVLGSSGVKIVEQDVGVEKHAARLEEGRVGVCS